QPPPNEDCPICFLRLPLGQSEIHYQSCCGKIVCYGCAFAGVIARASTEQICPFCRTPHESSRDEGIERLRKRIEARDTNAMHMLGCRYFRGVGVPQDYNKALELWHRAAKLCCKLSHCRIANTYNRGEGVEEDVKKAKYHWKLGAMGGDAESRYNLGLFEEEIEGNMNRAIKHFMISAVFGHDDSLKKIQDGFSDGHVTKDDFEKALRAHKESKDEMQSGQRDEALHYLRKQRLHS
ncbi:hypothetical protein ACHAXR_002090, partial [Thalassiosira sp. AJA248-18]